MLCSKLSKAFLIKSYLKKVSREKLFRKINTTRAGTGILLEYLRKKGFEELVGVEPSAAAIAAAPIIRQKSLREDIFEEKNFTLCSFDLICCFMTMEHVYDPEEVARASYNLLRSGGIFVTITHDYRSFINRVLGKNSPIIDIEHTHLFSKKSIEELFTHAGYIGIAVQLLKNNYSLRYSLRLTPLPYFIKSAISSLIVMYRLSNLKLGINVGNFSSYGIK